MNASRKQRYALAVYLLLAAFSFILLLVGINYYGEASPGRDLLLNLSTELLGVVLIFFVVNRLFFLDRESDLLGEIQSLKRGINARFNPLVSGEEGRRGFALEKHLESAQSIDLLGYTLSSLLDKMRPFLIKPIQRGAEVRILLVDPHGKAGDLKRDHSSKPDMVKTEAQKGLGFAEDIDSQVKSDADSRGTVEIRLTSWIPSCNMIIVNRSQEDGIAKVGINPPSYRRPAVARRFLIIERAEHPQDFEYFVEQFEALWNEDSKRLHQQGNR